MIEITAEEVAAARPRMEAQITQFIEDNPSIVTRIIMSWKRPDDLPSALAACIFEDEVRDQLREVIRDTVCAILLSQYASETPQ